MKQPDMADQTEPVTDHLWRIGSEYYAEKFRVDHEPDQGSLVGAVFMFIVACILGCGYHSGEYVPVHVTTRGLLADFFEIDEAKLEREKLAMLAELRGEQAQETGSAP